MVNMRFDYPYKTREDFLKDVVVILRKKRIDMNISQQDLNYKLGVADFLVAKWENGIRTPLTFHLYCWADALDCKLTIVNKTKLESPNEMGKGVNSKTFS